MKVKTQKRISSARKTISYGLRDTYFGVCKNLSASWKTIRNGKIFRGFLKAIFQTPVDAFLLLIGKLLSAFQVLFGIETVGRNLTSVEIDILTKIFAKSIDYKKIRIKEDKLGLFRLIHAPFTHGDTIYVQPNWVKNKPQEIQLFVHETVHIWQHQNRGTNYMSESIFAQTWGILRTGDRGFGYNFLRGIVEGKSFEKLNPEQQASLIETAFAFNFFENEAAEFEYKNEKLTKYLKDALKIVRNQNKGKN